MHFDLTEDQKEIKRVARELLAARSSWARVREAAEARRAYDPALWDELCALGWPGIAVAEEHGGQGLGAVELAVLLEELGYACAATPFLSTAAAAAAIQACGSDAQRARWLPALASGEATAGIGTRALCADGVGADGARAARTAVRRGDARDRRGRARRWRRSTRRAATRPSAAATPSRSAPAAPARSRPPTASAPRSPPRSSASRSARSR